MDWWLGNHRHVYVAPYAWINVTDTSVALNLGRKFHIRMWVEAPWTGVYVILGSRVFEWYL